MRPSANSKYASVHRGPSLKKTNKKMGLYTRWFSAKTRRTIETIRRQQSKVVCTPDVLQWLADMIGV